MQREVNPTEVRAEIKGLQWVAGHPNVIQLRGLFEDRIAVHLVMDLCSGKHLPWMQSKLWNDCRISASSSLFHTHAQCHTPYAGTVHST